MDALITVLLAHPFIVIFSLIAAGLVLNAVIGIEGLYGFTHPFHLYNFDHRRTRRQLLRFVRKSRQSSLPRTE